MTISRSASVRALLGAVSLGAVSLGGAIACAARSPLPTIAGDWDAYVALRATPRPGFEGWRRMGFAHFTVDGDSVAGAVRRRTAEPMLDVRRVVARGDSVELLGAIDQRFEGAWHLDTLVGALFANGRPAGRRLKLVRRSTPFVVERLYELWPGAVSDSQYAVTEDTL